MSDLPEPVCEYGYNSEQISEMMGDRLAEFRAWHRGQTGALCEGHGALVYRHDVERFLAGLPNVD